MVDRYASRQSSQTPPSSKPNQGTKTQKKKKPVPLKHIPGDPAIAQILARNGNEPVVLESGYTAVLWSIDDVLSSHQSTAEQSIYRQLYRLSYGFGNTHCIIGYDSLKRRCQVTINTLRKALSSLAKKKHIAILENVNTKGTVYRVFRPEEIDGVKEEVQEYHENEEEAASSEDEGNIEPDREETTEQKKAVDETDTLPKNATVSKIDRVSKNATVSKVDSLGSVTVSKIDTNRTDIKDSRTDMYLEPTPVRTPNRVQSRNVDNFGLEAKEHKKEKQPEEKISDLDQAYIYSLHPDHQWELLEAMCRWEKVFPEQTLPKASQLGEWLQRIRDRDDYFKGDDLLKLLEHALQSTRERQPDDVIGWLNAGFRKGYAIQPKVLSD